jgi:hypothetical protein
VIQSDSKSFDIRRPFFLDRFSAGKPGGDLGSHPTRISPHPDVEMEAETIGA